MMATTALTPMAMFSPAPPFLAGGAATAFAVETFSVIFILLKRYTR